jgi:hypothetical protein
MLWNASKIDGHAVAARDGNIGRIEDFLFDDISWHIRWAVVNTGNWLSGRKVLLPTSALGHPDSSGREFPVELTMQQVKDSPDIDTERPVSRHMETSVYGYYGWNPYWGNGLYMGAYGYGGGVSASPSLGRSMDEQEIADAEMDNDDPHLRSIKAVSGYHVHAADGSIGHDEDFLIEDADWRIHYLVIDTKNWWPGKRALISPRSVRSIEWRDRLLHLGIDRQTVKASPAYDPELAVDPAYEKRLEEYYGGASPADGH